MPPGSPIDRVPLAAELSLDEAAEAYRFLYSTTNQHGAAVSTAALFLPAGDAPEGGWPVIAWAHGTTGLGDDCAPSAQPRSARLPANLLQAQRDYFGAHTYERVDRPRGEFFHTNWTGRGGNTASTTYDV